MTTPTTCQIQYQQRQLGALWTIPPPRRNLVSPYINTIDFLGNSIPQVSKKQLDMRRKVEILKYANMNSQANGTTKFQGWSRLNTQSSVGTYSQYALQNMMTIPLPTCVADRLLPTSTTACDVPGPPIMLQYDPTIPLYNYTTNTDSYAILPPSPTFMFELYTKNEIYYINNYTGTIPLDVSENIITGIIAKTTTNNIGVLTIGTGLLSSSNIFVLNIPVGLWIHGYISPQVISALSGQSLPISISISSCTIDVLYNEGVIYSTTIPSSLGQPLRFNVTDLNNEPSYNFYAIQYIGNLVANLVLPIQPGYIYTVQVTYTYSYNNMPSIIFDTGGIQTGVFSNLTLDNTNIQSNCILTSTPPANYVASSFVKFAVPPAFGLVDI